MTDVHSPATRSKNMRAIRNSNTSIERKLNEILEQLGVFFRTQVQELEGRPDFVIDEYKAVIFTHGCFWHKHQCHLSKMPKTRTEFWANKIGKNIYRDNLITKQLLVKRWRILVIWECALKGRLKLNDKDITERLEEWLCAGNIYAEIDTLGIH
ncbi:very short patch repair endonuclease [Yersinia sp. 2541 StPb PI]|uniref:very short patch repair endonuclease n=1 Tax=Yersinia sp. 2541 StPb PI TaxID=3117407 RepID=UPI003FA46A6F